jgi:hypothetical protein
MSRKVIALATLLAVAIHLPPAAAETGRSIELVLDASGSMNAKLPEGTTRIAAAKAAVANLVGGLGADTRLAFRAYGHQSSPKKKDCNDSALVVGFDAVAANKAAVLSEKEAINAQGYTPINHSLQLAAKDLATEETAERVVLLVSDGKETCAGDPCATAKALAEADAKLVVHTVGFGVDAVTRQQLQCIAKVARGSYFDASSTGELTSALSKAAQTKAADPVPAKKQIVVTTQKFGKLKMEVEGHFSHDVVNASGQTVDSLSSVNRVVELSPGIYSVKFGNGNWTGIEVKAGETAEIKPGYLEVEPTGGKFAYVLEPETGEVVEEILFAKPRATLIPGRFDVKFGNLLWPGGVELKPGETTTIKPGVLKVKSDLGIFRFLLRTPDGQEAADGDVPGATQIALPPGKYMLEIDPDKWIKQLGDEQRKMEVELSAGQEYELSIE